MISKQIMNLAKKAMPAEEKAVNRMRAFFSNRTRRLIVSGCSALVFGFLCIEVVINQKYQRVPRYFFFMEILFAFIFFTAFGEFCASVGKEKVAMKRFFIADIIPALLLFLVTPLLGIMSTIAFDQLDRLPLAILIEIAKSFIMFVIPLTISLLLAKFIFHKKCT